MGILGRKKETEELMSLILHNTIGNILGISDVHDRGSA